MKFTNVLIVVLLAAQRSLAARILAFLPLDISSHHHFCQPILRELAVRGHEVTVITPIELENPPKNYREILVPKLKLWDLKKDVLGDNNIFKSDPVTVYTNQMELWNCTLKMTETVIKSSEFQDFIAKDNTKYDLVIYEAFYQEAFLVYASKYNAPIVAISTFGSAHFLNQMMGNPYELSYASHEFMEFTGRLFFFERLRNVFWTMVDLYERSSYLLFEHEELVKKNSNHLPLNLKSISAIENNVSLALVNSHFSIDGVRANVPGIVEIGGIHIQKPKPLPEDIKIFMDGAKDGVIYFSLGSTFTSNDVPKEYVDVFIKVFSGLKQRVIWKWDDDKLAGKPNNLMTSKWLPQADILAHPNMKLFINQGGALSIQEAVSRSVPVICLPLYGDQFRQCAQAKRLGFGEDVIVNKITEESLAKTIKDLLQNQSYKKKVSKVSGLFEDRPMSAMQSAMYWIEYVIRHKGALHISSPARDMTWYEHNLIDVSLLIVVFIYLFYCTLSWLFFNVALRKKIPRDDLKDLIEQHKPKRKMN